MKLDTSLLYYIRQVNGVKLAV